MSWVTVVVAVLTVLAVIRLCGWLASRIAHEAATSCHACGIEITEGWVIYRVVPSDGDPPHGAPPTYWCSRHRPADAHAVPFGHRRC